MTGMGLEEQDRAWFARMAERMQMGEACVLRGRLSPSLWRQEHVLDFKPKWPESDQLKTLGRFELGAWSSGLGWRARRRLCRSRSLSHAGPWWRREKLEKGSAAVLESSLLAPWLQELDYFERAGLCRLVRLEAPREKDKIEAWIRTAPGPYQAAIRLALSLFSTSAGEGGDRS
ncbi:MAG: hypothetical protein JRF33_01560 [Deltaproteobacteria bacterium]|nr:hypothetical protein [Deltaproteobacteria bacterium]